MLIPRKSLLRLSSLDSGITVREPDKRDETDTESSEKTKHSSGYLYLNEGGLEGASLQPAVWLHDHGFLYVLCKAESSRRTGTFTATPDKHSYM